MSHPLVAVVPPRTPASKLTSEERAELRRWSHEGAKGYFVSLGTEGAYQKMPVRYDD